MAAVIENLIFKKEFKFKNINLQTYINCRFFSFYFAIAFALLFG